MNAVYLSRSLALFLLAAPACTAERNSESGSSTASAADELAIVAPMPIGHSQFESPMAELARSGKPIPRRLLLEGFLAAEESAFLDSLSEKEFAALDSRAIEDAKEKLERIVELSRRSPAGPLPEKAEIEKALQDVIDRKTEGETVSGTIFDLFGGPRWRPESETSLYLYAHLASTPAQIYQQSHPIVLVESGRRTPGFALLDPQSGRFRIVGIDMTVSSGAVIDYGYAGELQKNPRVQSQGLRVLDAPSFLALEVLGELFESDEDYDSYVQTLLEVTALRYGARLTPLENIVAECAARPSAAFGAPVTEFSIDTRRRGDGFETIAEMKRYLEKRE